MSVVRVVRALFVTPTRHTDGRVRCSQFFSTASRLLNAANDRLSSYSFCLSVWRFMVPCHVQRRGREAMHSRAASVGEPAARPSLTTRVVNRSALSEREVVAMHDLLAQHFLGVDRQTFLRDLSEKNWVVLLEDGSGTLRGFSTFLIYATAVDRRPITVVYSGDTIVEPSAWGSPALPRAWIRAVYDAARGYPAGDLYWLLLDVRISNVPFRVRVLPRLLPQVRRSNAARVTAPSGCLERRTFRPRVRCPRGARAVLEASGPSRASERRARRTIGGPARAVLSRAQSWPHRGR